MLMMMKKMLREPFEFVNLCCCCVVRYVYLGTNNKKIALVCSAAVFSVAVVGFFFCCCPVFYKNFDYEFQNWTVFFLWLSQKNDLKRIHKQVQNECQTKKETKTTCSQAVHTVLAKYFC